MSPSSRSTTSKSKPTLHETIRSAIEKRILSGELKPGDRIPFEHELMESYDCSRMTVNKAVTELVNKGLIVRRRRAGSFVAQPPSDSTMLDIPDIQADLQQRGKAYSYRLLKRRIRNARKTRNNEMELARNGRLLDLVSLHGADGKAYALEQRLISLETVSDAADADFSVSPPGTWLLDHVPWSQAEHRISAKAADEETARLLDVEIGSPCLVLERQTWHDNLPVTHVQQTFPGERHTFVGSFSHKF
ncbi:histidine utilization repressor [Henriciella sp. AS95]|uniref:histidine utilization repressor n=1 Tax=Henriciella sp. AS95 TaxID=3135782 RepID=UPI0031738F88